MKEDWVERRKETALKEFEVARRDLLARQSKSRDPMESSVIAGMLALVEGGIRGIALEDSPMPHWFQGLLYGLANPLIGAKYRKVLATLKKFDIEEINDVPGEVLESSTIGKATRTSVCLPCKRPTMLGNCTGW